MNRLSYGLVAAVSCFVFSGGVAKGNVVFSSFVSGTTWSCCSGLGVSGASSSTRSQQFVAAAFTPSVGSTLAQIDVAFWYPVFVPDQDAFTLSLNQDFQGVPGAAIETWTGLTAPSPLTLGLGTTSVVESVFAASTISLLPGQQYWVVASPASATSGVVWNFNAISSTGPGGIYGNSNNGVGWGTINNPDLDLAFDVLGTPEPGTIVLMSTVFAGLGGLGLFRKLRRA